LQAPLQALAEWAGRNAQPAVAAACVEWGEQARAMRCSAAGRDGA